MAAVGTEESMDASTLKAIENSSNLPSTPEAAAAPQEVKVPAKPKITVKAKKPATKVAHKEKKSDSAPKMVERKVAHKVKKNDDLPPEIKIRDDSLEVRTFKEDAPKSSNKDDEDAPAGDTNTAVAEAGAELPADPQADAQADEIVEQIKAASANIRSADGTGEEQIKGLEGLLDNAASLLQISEDIRIDPEAELAFDYLQHQFPEDYPEEKKVEKKVELTEEQKEKQEK
jgi:hypothetical protein